jgi:hypothetical protein
MTLTRRAFFETAAGAAAALTAAMTRPAVALASPFGWPIGCQTFPYGKLIDQDFPGTMKMLASAGIESIELCSPWYSEHNFGFGSLNTISAAEFRRVIGDVGLTCVSSHVDMTELRGDKLPWIIDWAKARGLTQIMVPSLDGPRNPTMDQVKVLADEYNRIGEVSANAGLHQGLHHEGFENSMVEGRRVFDVLFDLLDPRFVKFQFQMSTITSGMVADEYFTKWRAADASDRPRQHRLGEDVPGRQGGRRSKLLHRDERDPDAGERAVSSTTTGVRTRCLR